MSTADQVICLLSQPFLPAEQKSSSVEKRTEKANFSSCARTPEDVIQSWSQLWRTRFVPSYHCKTRKLSCSRTALFLPSNPWDTSPALSRQSSPYTCMEISSRHRSGALLLTVLLFVLLLHALACVYSFKLDSFRHLCYACKLSTPVQWKTAPLRLRQALHRKTKVCSTCCSETIFTLWLTSMHYPPETSALFQIW